MKKIIYSIVLVMTIIFSGCGGGGGDNTPSSIPNTTETSLELNIKTEVKSGTIYEARSSDAIVEIEHDLLTNKRYITLVQGQGALIN